MNLDGRKILINGDEWVVKYKDLKDENAQAQALFRTCEIVIDPDYHDMIVIKGLFHEIAHVYFRKLKGIFPGVSEEQEELFCELMEDYLYMLIRDNDFNFVKGKKK